MKFLLPLIISAAIISLSSCKSLFNDVKLTGGLTYDPATNTFGVQVGKEPIPKAP